MNELDIHIRLKEARKYLELNQLKIANDLDIKQKTVSEIENGKIMNIPNKYIYYFYEKGISLEWLYTGEGDMLKSNNLKEGKIGADIESIFPEKKLSNKENLPNKEKSDENNFLKEDYFSLLLNSKEENIQSLVNYIHSQEKMIIFLQEIIRKELKL